MPIASDINRDAAMVRAVTVEASFCRRQRELTVYIVPLAVLACDT
jgi:hypothetical protein